MNVLKLAGTTGLALIALGACSSTRTAVDCGAMNVIMTESQRDAIQAKTGESHFAADVCTVAEKIDPSEYSKSKPVTITMPSGDAYDVRLEASP